MSMMFITHDLGVIGDIADDVVVMYRSNVVEQSNAKEIFLSPKHPYTKGLLACRPRLGANPRRLLTVSDFMTEAGEEIKINVEKTEVFDKEDIDIRDSMTANDIEEWDSLAHITLIIAIEKRFGIKFTVTELARLSNVGEMIKLIEKKTQK